MRSRLALKRSNFCSVSITFVFLLSFLTFKAKAQITYEKVGRDSIRAMIPDEKTAIRIAVAVWLPLYGKKIKQEKPYVATLKENDVWEVKGTLAKRWKYGGVAYAWIQKSDGKIQKVIHEK